MSDSIDDQIKKMNEAREKLKEKLDAAETTFNSADKTLRNMQRRQQERMRADKRMTNTSSADQLKEAHEDEEADKKVVDE
jgi:hypothetical protein